MQIQYNKLRSSASRKSLEIPDHSEQLGLPHTILYRSLGTPLLLSNTIMVLGRLAHYGFDLLAVSTIAAGIKKSTGFA